ncbi:MAG: endo-1,4-beta-xylanase [Bradyrhizobium sp.]|uniref:endo-1,4-beta-xylanase n=1 Tax=Bradyrhizobium sp. TaxID=376 RepID=UPI001C28F04E|nr:endo-1,4-beta-xylanase [Bradyrhizobium sp.]MBU6461942.1 endo-1,4-beta-xylanase [Pseudomonadota bacterium]MDE2066919.1 endo-1,4-beta-xylanase [Bradyrhizobium sp.]MDE2241288.1 endo-1,4-beta-xylanase [Bradyrhizobium sp.]MDE2473325.1 endo-1,4-beta-xylanase [Bradyrhizobium sp.]
MPKKTHSRRDFLLDAAKLAALGISGASVPSGVPALATPLDQARANPVDGGGMIPYGAAARSDALVSDLSYRDAIVSNCQLIVPESELKWLELRPTRNEYRFEKSDMIVDFARQNRLQVRGHTLAWYGAMPAWTEEISTHVEAERELTDHIDTVVSRYRGEIPSWDVINEPLAEWPENESSFRPSIWARRLGADYLTIALRQTALADPGAQLVLNEYDIEFKGPRFAARRKALIALLRSLRDRDVPLHAVGLQAHLFADRAIDRDGLQSLLMEIAALKLDLLITELDVIDYELPGKISERDAMVANVARQFLETVGEVTRPKAILTWGISDRYTWVPTYFKRKDGMPNRPLPLDADLKRKPLFDVIDEFRHRSA